jgi:hypothetical protein
MPLKHTGCSNFNSSMVGTRWAVNEKKIAAIESPDAQEQCQEDHVYYQPAIALTHLIYDAV